MDLTLRFLLQFLYDIVCNSEFFTSWFNLFSLLICDFISDTLSIDNSVSLLLLIGRIIPCLPSRYRHDDDSDSDDDDDMDTDDQMQVKLTPC